MTGIGIPLPTFEEGTFRKVPAHMRRNPGRSFDLADRLGQRVADWAQDRYGDRKKVELKDIAHSIPMEIYRRITPDELCKVRYSSTFMMDTSVEDAFKREPQLTVFQKIVSSMWRWGVGRGDWNEIVDCYEGIRRFDLGHPDFELRLDHTTGYNERGYSEHSRTFLDGVFGYLVHYKGEHVMTLGFSLMEGRKLLIQQVQTKNRSGNRFLFKLPRNTLEHVVDRFKDAFPRHRVFLVDGESLMDQNIANYRSGLEQAKRSEEDARRRLEKADPVSDPESVRYGRLRLESALEDREEFSTKIAHAEGDKPRIGAFYAGAGRHRRGKVLKVNGLKHYELELGDPAPGA